MYGNQNQLRALPTTFGVQPRQAQDQGPGYWKLLVLGGDLSRFSIETDDDKIVGGIMDKNWVFHQPTKPDIFNGPAPDINIGDNGQPGIHRVQTKFKLSILSTNQPDPAEVSELFNQIAPLNPENETKLEDLLRRSIEPRLRRLRYAKPQGTHTHLIYVDLGEGPMLPFTQLGQAFARTLQVYCEIFANRPQILLIDEIENGLYYEGLEDYWKGLLAVLEDQDVQLFATTHSRECMEAAHRAAVPLDDDPLRFLRLDRRVDDPAKIVATTFGKEEMQTAIEFNREMR